MFLILGWLLLGVAVIMAVALALASRRPDTFRIARSATIHAAPERIFPLINDLKAMTTWNVFSLRDPSAKLGFSGPASGTGAEHTFAGPKSGTGSIAIIEAVAPTRVALRLRMTKPVSADNDCGFTLAPVGADTLVTWSMSGRQPLLFRLMTLVFDHDKMVGDAFDEGLANLKRMAEKA